METCDLLKNFVENGDEAAFAALVDRHLAMVYSVARRRVDNHHLAEDVCQEVFALLARKARSLTAHPAIHAWLFRTTFYHCTKEHRERRKQAREKQAWLDQTSTMKNSTQEAQDSEAMLSLLDECVDKLADDDRELVLQRYYRGHSFKAIGDGVGISENACQKRMTRIVHKLEKLMIARGGAVSAVSLASILSLSTAEAAPAGLASAVTRHVLDAPVHQSFLGSLWLGLHLKAAILAAAIGFSLPFGGQWLSTRTSAAQATLSQVTTIEPTSNRLTTVLANDPFFGDASDPAEQMRLILDLGDQEQRLREIRFLVKHLKPSEVAQALAVLTEREPEDWEHLGAFVESWVTFDPLAAVAFIDARMPAYRERYSESLIRGWVTSDPEGSWNHVATQIDGPHGDTILNFWVREMSYHHPTKALTFLGTLQDSSGEHHYRQLFNHWPPEQLDAAFDAISEIENQEWAHKALDALGEAFSIRIDADFFAKAARTIPASLLAELEAKLVGSWLVKAGDPAIAFARSIDDPSVRAAIAEEAIAHQNWPHGEHEKILQYIQEVVPPEDAIPSLTKLFASWLAFTDGKASVLAFHSLTPEQQGAVAKDLGSYMAHRDPDRVYEQGEQVADETARTDYYIESVKQLAEIDLAKAIALVERIDSEPVLQSAFPQLAKAYAQEDPEAAIAWALEAAPTDKAPEVIRDSVERWAKTDTAAASAWHEALTDPETRDLSAAAFSESMLDYPKVAADWALSITNDSARIDALDQVATSWAEQHAVAFKEWLDLQATPVKEALIERNSTWVALIQD